MRRWGSSIVCGVSLAAAVAAVGLAAATATTPPAGHWLAKGNQFSGSFQVTANSRYVTKLHGTALAGATNGCPVVHPHETVVLPAKLPITHVLSTDSYVVEGPSKVAEIPLKTTVIAGGTRHTDGAIEVFWDLQPNGQPIAEISLTWGELAQGCHISFSAVKG